MMSKGTTESRGIFSLRDNDSGSSPKMEVLSSVKKTIATLKKAMTDRHARWPNKEWYSKTKTTLAAVTW